MILPILITQDEFLRLADEERVEVQQWLSQVCLVSEPIADWYEIVVFPAGVVVYSLLRTPNGERVAATSNGQPRTRQTIYPAPTDRHPQCLHRIQRRWRWPMRKTSYPHHQRDSARHHNPIKEIRITMADVTVKDSDEPVTAELLFVDAGGNPTMPDDIPQWSSNNEAVARVSSATVDGTKATIAFGSIGVATIVATSTDKDGTKLVAEGSIEVTAGEAVHASIKFNVPEVPVPVEVPATPEPSLDGTAVAPAPEPEPAVVDQPAPSASLDVPGGSSDEAAASPAAAPEAESVATAAA